MRTSSIDPLKRSAAALVAPMKAAVTAALSCDVVVGVTATPSTKRLLFVPSQVYATWCQVAVDGAAVEISAVPSLRITRSWVELRPSFMALEAPVIETMLLALAGSAPISIQAAIDWAAL